MAILFRRLLVSVLVPFLWKRWRNRRTGPADASKPRRSAREADAEALTSTSR